MLNIQSITTRSLRILQSYHGNLCVYIDSKWCHSRDISQRYDLLYYLTCKNCFLLYHLSLDSCEDAEEYVIQLGAMNLPCLARFQNGKLQFLFSEKNQSMESFVQELSIDQFSSPVPNIQNFFKQYQGSAIRIFISGDKSSVGKSTICQYLLASFLNLGISPHELAYIKPVTQCEAEQSVVQFCNEQGIACCGIGPVVFYKGFTRAYLEGITDNTAELLLHIQRSVEDISVGKKIVLIDGVGYPSVGSICGVSNADTAAILDAPVLLVSKYGVGDAVDSFNLNACYFQSKGVTVLGAIFNKIPLDGYYNVEACRTALTSYFTQFAPQYKTYGFLPIFNDQNSRHSETFASNIISEEVFQVFMSHVNVPMLLEDMLLYQIKTDNIRLSRDNHRSPVTRSLNEIHSLNVPNKESSKRLFHDISLPSPSPMIEPNHPLIRETAKVKKSRQDIEVEAFCSGAKAG